MGTQKMIAIKEFCSHHKISVEFIRELHRNEIIELVMVKKTGFIPLKHLNSVERAIRLYRELDINIEGIQTIVHLLSALERKEAELTALKNALAFYGA